MPTFTIIRSVVAAVVIIAIVALGAWYFFLRSQTQTSQINDAARGVDTQAPSFGGSSGSTYVNTVSTVTGNTQSTAPTQAPPQLWHITAAPIAGMGFVRSGGTEQLYFVERAAGNILTADPVSGLVTRLTNTLMPKINDALITHDGSVVLRSLDESGRITTFLGTIATTSASTAQATSSPLSLYGRSLELDLKTFALNPTTREIFYTMNDSSAGTIGIRSQWNGTKQKRVLSSLISGWQTQWLLDGRIILTENAVDDVPGYAYELKADGSLVTLVRNIPGLTVLPRASSSAIIYGQSSSGSLALFAQADQKTAPVRLPIKTIADKCVWAPSKDLIAYCAVPQTLNGTNFLTNWYMGITHIPDAWYRVDVKTGSAEILNIAQSSDSGIDVENPLLDDSGTYLTFTNAADKSLWMLHINGAQATSTSQTH